MHSIYSLVVMKEKGKKIEINVAYNEKDLTEDGFLKSGKGYRFNSLKSFKEWATRPSRLKHNVEWFVLNPEYMGGWDKKMENQELYKVLAWLEEYL